MSSYRLTLQRLAGAACLLALTASVVPCAAASDATEAFRANVRLRVAFLMKASDYAKTHAAGERIRAFAISQQSEQLGVLAALDTPDRPAGTTMTEAGSNTGAAGSVLTGRSAADGSEIDASTFASPLAGVLMPAAAAGLQHLAEAKGQAFDALYAALARNVLADLSGFYEVYATAGDDPSLRALAARERTKADSGRAALE